MAQRLGGVAEERFAEVFAEASRGG